MSLPESFVRRVMGRNCSPSTRERAIAFGVNSGRPRRPIFSSGREARGAGDRSPQFPGFDSALERRRRPAARYCDCARVAKESRGDHRRGSAGQSEPVRDQVKRAAPSIPARIISRIDWPFLLRSQVEGRSHDGVVPHARRVSPEGGLAKVLGCRMLGRCCSHAWSRVLWPQRARRCGPGCSFW